MNPSNPWKAVVIGGSAGSLDALSAILHELPGEYPLPIFGVVHLPAGKKSYLPEVLQTKCALSVREAQDKEPIRPGTVYFAPPDYHLLVENEEYLALSCDEPVLFSRPSIDVLFESAADTYGERLIGIVLSGANGDGSLGLKAIRAEGGLVLVQSPADSYASTMPFAALAECPDAMTLTARELGLFLRDNAK